MKGERTLGILTVLSFVALIGIAYCYHKHNLAMQGAWSGVLLTSLTIHMFLNNELYDEEYEEEERKKEYDRRKKKRD